MDLFYSLAKDQAIVIRQKLLETLATEPDRTVRNKISDAVAEVARQYTDNSAYPGRPGSDYFMPQILILVLLRQTIRGLNCSVLYFN